MQFRRQHQCPCEFGPPLSENNYFMVPFCTIPVVGTVVALLSAGISAVLEQVVVLTCIPRWVRAAPGRLQIPLPSTCL